MDSVDQVEAGQGGHSLQSSAWNRFNDNDKWIISLNIVEIFLCVR